jgi:hypothetical protein
MNTREEWLLKATDVMRERLFKARTIILPEVKVSVGFPGGGNARKRVGEHWNPKATNDGISQIFISPTVDDPYQALEILTHELCHAVHPDDGHGREFRRTAMGVGLIGPMRNTVASPKLKEKLGKLAAFLGPYPHSGINLKDRKKQDTRLVKVWCPLSQYTARTTNKWLKNYGPPICPCCKTPMLLEVDTL